MRTRTFFRYALLVFASAAVACGVHQQSTPGLTGPSEFALSVSVTALPDTINQDGGSQSSIRVVAHDASGQPKNGQSFRLDILVNGSEVDFGTLSARTIVTGSDGTAFAVYTAPPAQPTGSTVATCSTVNTPGALAGQCVTIAATPTGSNFSTSQTQTVEIHLTVPGIIVPAASGPTPSFVSAPAAPAVAAPVQFDASASCGGPLVSGACPSTGPSIVTYAWDFGDGSSGSGRVASHPFSLVQSYSVTLTVTNSGGLQASKTIVVAIGAGAGATGDFAVSPAAPSVNQVVVFNADGIRAAPGRTIVQYSWNFGDGGSASGSQATHTYTALDNYNVTLTVRDDADVKTTFTKSVPVAVNAGAAPLADFTFAPNSPVVHPFMVNFDASSSTPGNSATIVSYQWQFECASPLGAPVCTSGDAVTTATVPTIPHTYGAAGQFSIKLTVIDSTGNTGTFSRLITVQ